MRTQDEPPLHVVCAGLLSLKTQCLVTLGTAQGVHISPSSKLKRRKLPWLLGFLRGRTHNGCLQITACIKHGPRTRQLERLGPVRPLEDEDSAPGRARGLLWSFGLSKSTITASLQEHSQYLGYPYRVAGQSRLVLAGEVPRI